jgi:hypothetical protein
VKSTILSRLVAAFSGVLNTKVSLPALVAGAAIEDVIAGIAVERVGEIQPYRSS